MSKIDPVDCLAALAHAYRLRIFRLLVRQEPGGLPAGEIAKAVGIGATNASFHLKELEHAGLLRASRDGRTIRYAVNVDATRRLFTFLAEDCCAGRPELCGRASLGTPKRLRSKPAAVA